MPFLAAIVVIAAQAATVPIATPGTIAVVQTGASGSGPIARFEDAVERALSETGFTLIPDAAHARYVATTVVDRRVRGVAKTTVKPPKVSTGGGTTFGNGAGMGVQIPFGSAVHVSQLIATELTLRIAQRGATGEAWEGRAITYQVAGSRGDDPARLAKRLSSAILRNLSGPSGVLISVP